jgi:hypothetical protein
MFATGQPFTNGRDDSLALPGFMFATGQPFTIGGIGMLAGRYVPNADKKKALAGYGRA